MPSVVIAAHNEEHLIGSCLRAIADQDFSGDVQVVVSANGCTDRTAEVARQAGADVVDRPEPGKTAALNAGDGVATSFPRIYLDADIILPRDALSSFTTRLGSRAGCLAVVPRRRLETSGRPWAVRAYFAINERLPVFQTGLFGRGVIVLSEEGRSRFSTFPPLIADDLFLDSLYAEKERAVVNDVEVTVEAPHTTRDLLRRLVRVRRGNAQMRAAGAADLALTVRRPQRWSWLIDVVIPHPRLALAGIAYVSITLTAAILARRQVQDTARTWGRDESTRSGGS
ncbi:glycosyltransferase [Diaminobutyricibacter sp. McL0618]|uniref:glycosyltransferase n=1 Tax=Leifsonia sp. McL0618 TaxID=3415677 RepID=UPI003CF26422